jgi:hypothetical protein
LTNFNETAAQDIKKALKDGKTKSIGLKKIGTFYELSQTA